MLFGRDIGIDLGTANVVLTARGKGILSREPSVVAMDRTTGAILKVGVAAQRMLGRTPGNIAAIHPLSGGVICDFEMTEQMIRELLGKVNSFSLVKPRVILSVPSGITEVEERAVIDAAINAGARRVTLMESPVAAAVGAGLDIRKPEGNLIVNIGAGTTDVAVLSLGGVVLAESVKAAGDAFDEAIIKYIRRKHNLLIGKTTAEELKRTIGCVFPKPEEAQAEIKGRDLMTGLPRMISVTSSETIEAFDEVSR
ncbi:MAG: rod shape-determining protein, partial [bacterium]